MGHWASIVRKDTKDRAKKAREFFKQGMSVKQIAQKISRSESRIREYLRGKAGENWNSND